MGDKTEVDQNAAELVAAFTAVIVGTIAALPVGRGFLLAPTRCRLGGG